MLPILVVAEANLVLDDLVCQRCFQASEAPSETAIPVVLHCVLAEPPIRMRYQVEVEPGKNLFEMIANPKGYRIPSSAIAYAYQNV